MPRTLPTLPDTLPADVLDAVTRGRDPEHAGVPLPGSATRAYVDPDGTVRVRYHATDVVTFHPDGLVTVRHGGWTSLTTASRIGDYAPRAVVSRAGGTFALHLYGDDVPTPYAPGSVEYALAPSGDASVTYCPREGLAVAVTPDPRAARRAREDRDRVNAYADGFPVVDAARAILDGDTAGDCLACALHDTDDPAREVMGSNHLAAHVVEDYAPSTLLLRALHFAGYRSPGVTLATVAGDLPTAYRADDVDRVRRAVRQYLTARVSLPLPTDLY